MSQTLHSTEAECQATVEEALPIMSAYVSFFLVLAAASLEYTNYVPKDLIAATDL